MWKSIVVDQQNWLLWGRLSLVPTPVRGNVAISKALDVILTKTRGAAGQELVRHEKEFTILNGSYAKFDYVVLYGVHTLNGPEGDALQKDY